MGRIKRTRHIENGFRVLENFLKSQQVFQKHYYFFKKINNGILIDKTFIEFEKCSFNGAIIIKKNNTYTNIVDNLFDCELINVFRLSDEPLSDPSIHAKIITIDGETKYYLKQIIYRYEDPRVFTFNNNLYMTTNFLANVGGHFVSRMKMFLLDDNLNIADEKYLDIGYNFSEGNQLEKNWIFFQHKDKICVIYSIHPFVIYSLTLNPNDLKDPNVAIEKIVHFDWNWTLAENIRGGTTTVFIDHHYYMFAHSKINYDKYAIIIIQFDSNLQLKKRSDLLYFGDFGIIFPVGCVYVTEEEKFYVTCGVEDREQYILTYTKKQVDSLLKEI